MSYRTELFKQFGEQFHTGNRRRSTNPDLIGEAESALKLLLPNSYRQFAMEAGAVYCPTLPSVQQFLTPKQIVTETCRWKLELTNYAIFASDGMGNWFLFRDLPPEEPRFDDAPVWLFDLENGEPVQEAVTFVDWISYFLKR